MVTGACMTSCLKTVSNNNQNNPSQVAFINVSPSRPSFNVLLDGANEGSNQVYPYMGYLIDGKDTGLKYTSVFAGIHYISFQDSADVDSIFAGGNIQFAANTKYSVYLFDTLTNFGLQAVQIQDSYDSIPQVTPQSAIRFLNFSQDTTGAGLDVIYNDTTLWYYNFLYIGNSNSSAATLSQYTDLPAGRYIFDIYRAGTENYTTSGIAGSTILDKPQSPPFASDTIVTLPNKAYTIVVSGIVSASPSSPYAFRLTTVKMN
jgi:hypothetical protein